jgi:SOS-response transcriptional repressor LexA
VHELTGQQKMVLRTICRHLMENLVPPTLRELMRSTGIASPNGITCHLRALAKKRYIAWRSADESRARDIFPAGMKMKKIECLSPDGKWIFSGVRPLIDGGKKGQRLLAALATT